MILSVTERAKTYLKNAGKPNVSLKVKGDYLQSPFNSIVPDIARITSLGWKPKISPAEGFRRMIESYLI